MAITTAQDGAWPDAGTWVGGVPPGAGDDAVIAHNVTIALGTDPEILALTVDAGKSLTVAAGASINVIGAMVINGTLAGGGDAYAAASIAVGAAGAITTTGFVWSFDTAADTTITVTAGGTITSATFTVQNIGVTTCAMASAVTLGGNFVFANGKFATSAFAFVAASFDMNNGTLTGSGSITTNHATAAHLTIDGGTNSFTGTFTMGTGNLNVNSYGNRLSSLTITSGKTCTASGGGRVKKLVMDGASLIGDPVLIYPAAANFFSAVGGTVTCSLLTLYHDGTGTYANAAQIIAKGTNGLLCTGGNGKGFTLSGGADCTGKTFAVYATANDATFTVTMGAALSAANWTLNNGNALGALNLATFSHTCTGTISGGTNVAGTDKSDLNFGTCTITLTGGTLNGANITADAGTSCNIIGGTIQNLTLDSGEILAYTSTDGGSNSDNVIFMSSGVVSLPMIGVGL